MKAEPVRRSPFFAREPARFEVRLVCPGLMGNGVESHFPQ